MRYLYYGLLLCVFELSALNLYSQEAKILPQDTTINTINTLDGFDSERIDLPPVTEFLNAAESYSDVKFQEQRIKEQELSLKISKKEWLKYFRLLANYQYGTNTDLTSQVTGTVYPVTINSHKVQSWYNAGVGISIPLDDLFSRKNKSDVARTQLQQTKFESQRTLETRQILILETYNEVVKNIALMKVKAEAVALYNAQMSISEKDFVNGRIDIITLSLERARRAEAIVRYQESKAALLNAVTILELLTKIRIIKK